MTTILVAIISGLSVAIPSIITSVVTAKNNKMASANNKEMIIYRITQLENKVEKHNQIVERMAIAEKDIKAVWKNIDELKKRG